MTQHKHGWEAITPNPKHSQEYCRITGAIESVWERRDEIVDNSVRQGWFLMQDEQTLDELDNLADWLEWYKAVLFDNEYRTDAEWMTRLGVA